MLLTTCLKAKTVAVPMAICLALSACASSDSSTYSRGDVGQVIETSEGRVLSSRPVEIKDDEGGVVGAAGGAVAGGVVGSTIGQGSGNTLATLAGVLLGAGAGYLAEREIRSDQGVEYLVEMDDGRVVTLVQNQSAGDPPIADGTPVLVQYGNNYTRIVPTTARSSAAAGGGAGGAIGRGGGGAVGGGTISTDDWRNPDLDPSYDSDTTVSGGPVIQTQSAPPLQ